jgi:hypothetical protein
MIKNLIIENQSLKLPINQMLELPINQNSPPARHKTPLFQAHKFFSQKQLPTALQSADPEQINGAISVRFYALEKPTSPFVL